MGCHLLEKIRAIKEEPALKNVTELHSFLGIINYYSKFLPNLSSKLTPLYSLLEKDKKWSWGPSKMPLFSWPRIHCTQILYYCTSTPTSHWCSCVMSHNSDWALTAANSQLLMHLNSAERIYSQLEHEALAIIYGVETFNAYLNGQKFIIYSDHKPLSFLFHAEKRIPDVASPGVQRWALTLVGYRYDIRYKAGTSLENADALSRLPLPESVACNGTTPEMEDVIDHIETTSVDTFQIADWTASDSILSQVKHQQCSFSPLVTSENTLIPL